MSTSPGSHGRPPAPEVASTATSAPSFPRGGATPWRRPSTSRCGSARTGRRLVSDRRGWSPGSADTIRGASRCGAAALASANFVENSPNTRCSLRGLDQPERGDVPEHRRAAVAETISHPSGRSKRSVRLDRMSATRALHRRLTVRGAEHCPAGGDERLDLLWSHLGRAAPEPSVGGQQVGGQAQLAEGGRGHCDSMSPDLQNLPKGFPSDNRDVI